MRISVLVAGLIDFYGWLIFAYVILSWFRPSGTLYEVYRALGTVVEPYVGVFRRFIPTAAVGGAGIDFSPLVAYLVLRIVIRTVVVGALRTAGL
ncbi:MAG: YggT family protein [Coriobacteriia bacterium]|nr:YggT family protein [Coriobacteriia bacterium]